MNNRCVNKKYHYLYKTTNLINKKYYYGIHSTNNMDDGYLGSGSYLRNSIYKYGKDNFKREIIKMFDNREDLANAEKDLLTKDIIQDKYCMNLMYGGEYFNTLGMVTVKDTNGKTFKVFCDDIRYLSGELVSVYKGMVTVKDINGNMMSVSTDDPRYLSGELVSNLKNMTLVKDKDGNIIHISVNDPRYLSGELVGITKGMTTFKDINGNTTSASVDDPRYLSGYLVGVAKDKKHTEETKKKIGEKNRINQIGEKNSQYGTCWITKDNENKKIIKDELDYYISLGWIKGRKIKNK